jgi:hypothetical protein
MQTYDTSIFSSAPKFETICKLIKPTLLVEVMLAEIWTITPGFFIALMDTTTLPFTYIGLPNLIMALASVLVLPVKVKRTVPAVSELLGDKLAVYAGSSVNRTGGVSRVEGLTSNDLALIGPLTRSASLLPFTPMLAEHVAVSLQVLICLAITGLPNPYSLYAPNISTFFTLCE